MLRGVDRAAFAVAFASRLRARGAGIGLPAIGDFVAALSIELPRTRQRLYWTARVTLVRREADLRLFDAVFAAAFDDAVLDMDPHARRNPLGTTPDDDAQQLSVPKASGPDEDGAGLPWATLPPAVGPATDDDDAVLAVPHRLPTELAGLSDVPFDELDPAQMTQLGQWLQSAVQVWPTRRSRRFSPDPHGRRVVLRTTIARARRTGWEPVVLVRASRVQRPRRVVMLCDVSQSMQAQATAYLHLMRALVLATDAEVFAFATSLTRLTVALRHRSPEQAIEQASAKVVDRFGGTRIASNLQLLLGSHRGDAVRGAVVLISSDGWDSDPPEQLGRAMARLRRRAHRVVWMNPRVAAPGFEPRVAGMAAALPHCDELVPADTFGSLAGVISQLGVSSRASRGSRAGTAPR